MDLWGLIFLSVVANGMARRLDADTAYCPLTCAPEADNLGYVVGKVYTYQYAAMTSSRVSGTADQQTSNSGFGARVLMQKLAGCHYLVNVETVQSETMSQAGIENLRASLTQYPLHLSWQGGIMEDICAHENESKETLNIKRGFLSAMQNTFNGNNPLKYENDVTGNCYTSYSMESGPGAANTVRKTKDLNKCTGERTRFQTSMLFTKYQADSTRKSLLKSTQGCNQTWSEDGVMTRSHCVEKHVFRPFSYRSKGAETVISQNLEMLGVGDADANPQQLTESKMRRTTISFEEIQTQNTVGEDTEHLTTALEEMCDLIQPNSPSGMMPGAFLKIVAAMKGLSWAGLRSVWDNIENQEICSIQPDKIRQTFMDSLSMCDKDDCVKLAVQLITSNSVDQKQKAAWVGSLSFVPKATESIIKSVRSLISGTEAMAESYLTLGSLIYRFCRDTKKCETNAVVLSALDTLQEPLGVNCHTGNAATTRKILLSLRALGNAGISGAIQTINSCIVESRNTPEVRLAAMNTFRRMWCSEDRSALKEVFANMEEDSEIRIAAYSALARCPSPDFVRSLMSLMQTEEVNQVGSYIWNHVMEVKDSSDPLKGYMRALFRSGNLPEKFSKDKRKYSSFYEKSIFSETLNLGAAMDGDLIWSTKSFIPRSARINMTVDLFGSAFNLLEIGGRIQGAERALERILGPAAQDNAFLATILGGNKEDGAVRAKRDAVDKYDGKLEEIQAKQPDLAKEEDPSASVFMRVFGNEMSFNTFGKEIEQQADAASWFGGLRTLFNLVAGSEYSIQHSRILADSVVVVPTAAGFPLELQVSGASTMDVSMGGQIDLKRILFEGFHVGGFIKPRATVEVHASMTTKTGPNTRSGIDLESTLTTSIDVNGTMSLTDSRNFRLKVDVPQDQIDVVNFRSRLFTLHDDERTAIVPTVPETQASWCTEAGSQMIGLQICSQLSKPSYSASAEDETPLFPLSGPAQYSFAIRKTDPMLSHYLLETTFDLQSTADSTVPEELTARFYVGTPGSQVDRSREMNFQFTSNMDDFNFRISTSERSVQIQANKQLSDTRKQAELIVTLDEMTTYRADASLQYTSSRTGGHVWSGNAHLITPSLKDAPPTVTGSFAYTVGKQMEGRLEITNVMTEAIVVQGDAEKTVGSERVSYVGNARVELPTCGSMEAQLRSSTRDGRDRTHLTINYELFGVEQQSIALLHKSGGSSTAEQDQWSIVTDVALSQFPSLNHKIQLKHDMSATESYSSFILDYGQNYDQKTNLRRFAVKQTLTNQTDETRTHLGGRWSLSAPEYEVDYGATLRHIFDWSTPKNKIAVLGGSFSQSEDSNPMTFDLRASDKSTHRKTNMECEATISTPWGDISALQRFIQIQPGLLMSFGNFGFGQAAGLQMQMVSNITTMDQRRGFSMHLYRPHPSETLRERTLDDDSSIVQPLPSEQDIVLFSSEWTTDSDWVLQGDYMISGLTVFESQWNNRFEMSSTISQDTTSVPQGVSGILTNKRFNFTVNHPSKVLQLSGIMQSEQSSTNNEDKNVQYCRRNASVRLEWTDSSSNRRFVEGRTQFNRVSPKAGKWDAAENRFDVSFSYELNDDNLQRYLPADVTAHARVYARPSVERTPFSTDHSFGLDLGLTGSNLSPKYLLQLTKEFRVGFSDLRNFILSMNLSGRLPSGLNFFGNSPQEFGTSGQVSVEQNGLSKASFVLSNNELEMMSFNMTLDLQEENRFVGQGHWKQDYFPEMLPNLSVNVAASIGEDQANLRTAFVLGQNQEQRCNASITYNRSQMQLLVVLEHNLSYLSHLTIPPHAQFMVRLSSRGEMETTLTLEVSGDSSVLASARFVITTPTEAVDPYTLRVVVEQNTSGFLPSLTEAVFTCYWNPQTKYGLGVRINSDAQEGEANAIIDLRNVQKIILNHNQGLSSLAGLPERSNIVLEFSNRGFEIRYSVDSIKSKLRYIAETLQIENGEMRTTMNLLITHNSQSLKEIWSFPKRVSMSIEMEGSPNVNLDRVASTLSFNAAIAETIFSSVISVIRFNDNGELDRVEMSLTGNHNLESFEQLGLPAEFDMRWTARKIDSGFTVRIIQSHGDERNHVELTMYARDIVNRDMPGYKVAAEVSHNYDYLTSQFGLPRRTAGSIQVEELDCCVGFWLQGEFEFGTTHTLRATTSLNCNETATTFTGHSEVSPKLASIIGLPQVLDTRIVGYAITVDKIAGLEGRISVDEEPNNFAMYISVPETGNSMDSYEISVQHTFETLKIAYSIPLNATVTITGKVTPWSYAKGNMELMADESYNFFRFNTGYKFNPKTQEYKFDYSMRYNIDMISFADNHTQAPVTKVSFSLKMDQGYSVWWDFALFQERFKGKMSLDYSPILFGFTYSVRHTFATLDSFGFPKNIDIGASVMMGSNNTFGTSLNVDFWRREMGFLATLAYTPGDETEVLESKFETRHNFKKSDWPKKIGSRLTLKRQGSNQLRLSLNSNVNKDKTRVDLSFKMEPESYQKRCSYVILLNRDPVDFSLFKAFGLTEVPISIQLSFEQPRERKRMEANLRLVYPGNRELLVSMGAGQSRIDEQGVDFALEMTNNVPFISDAGIPDGVHGTLNSRFETGKTERLVQAVSFRTSSGKHIDVDFNVQKHSHDRYEVSLISSQNVNFLVETLGYPRELQTSARISILDDQMSTRIRISVDQSSHYIQMTMHFPTEPPVSGQIQLTRSLQLSHDLPFFLTQLLIPRESEVIFNVVCRHNPNLAVWFLSIQEVRTSVTINVEQSAVVEISLTATIQPGNFDGTFTMQHNSQMFSEMGLPRSNRANFQLQMDADNHMVELEWTQNAITRRVVLRTTNQIIAADSKRAQREASFSFNHDIDRLSDTIPTSVKLTIRRMLRKVHPTFRVGATLWVGHNKLDLTSEFSEAVKVGTIGYAFRFGLNQDFSALLGYGLPRVSDLIVSAHPAPRGVIGGTAQVTLSRDKGEVNTISVTLKQDLASFEFSIGQDFPELSKYSVPQNIKGTVAYLQGANFHNLTAELCYNAKCIAVTPSYSVDKNTENILVSAEMTHNFDQLTNIEIPSNIKVELSCNLTPNSASIGYSFVVDEKEMEFNSGFNVSILTGEWSSRSKFAHTWDVLESQYDIPRQVSTSLAITRVQEKRVDVAGDIQIGHQTANWRVVLTGPNDSGYGDFSYYESHNFRVLRDLLIPNHLRLAGSLHKSSNGFQAGWGIEVNQFAVNTSISGTKSSTGYYDITLENAHNFNQDPIADQLSINLRAGSSDSSGFIGEVRSQVGRKKNTASISTRSTGKENSSSFTATLRQDMTSDLDETSLWYQLASSVEVVFTANIDTDTAAVSARCSIDEHSLELSYQHSRQSVSSWGVIGSVTQSLPKLTSLWPDLPQRITFSGDIMLITDGYQADVDFQYGGITESVQFQVTYKYNKDTRRNELLIRGSHNVDRWFDQYELPKQIQLTLFHDYQITDGDLSIAAGYLLQLDGKQVHMSSQMSLQNSVVSGSDRKSFQAYVDCGHGTTWLQEFGVPRSVRVSLEVTPIENGMNFRLQRSHEGVQKFISGSIYTLTNSEGKPAVEFTLNHNLDMLREMYLIPLSSRLNIFIQTNSGLSQVDTGFTLIGDERSFVSSISYELIETSFNAKFAEEITNWPFLSSYLLSSIDATVDMKVQGTIVRLTYEQNINTELERFEATCGYVSQSTNQIQQELTITMQHTFATLSAYDIPTDVRVVFGYQTADGRHTVSTDLTLGAQYARVTVYLQQEQSSVRVSFESEQSVFVPFGVPETIRTSVNVRWTQNSCSVALEYSTTPAKNNRIDVTLTWTPDQANIRNEVQIQLSQNVEELLRGGVPNENIFVLFYGKPKKNYYSFGYELEMDGRSARMTFTAKVRPSKFTLTVRGRHDFKLLSSQLGLPRVGKFEINAITDEQLRTWSLNAHSTMDGKNSNICYVICSLPKMEATDFHLQINASQNALVFLTNTLNVELKMTSDGWESGLMSVRVASDETFISATSEMKLNASTSYDFSYSSLFVMQHNIDTLAQYFIPTSYKSNMEIDFVSSSPFFNFTVISQPSESGESTTTSLFVDYSINATTCVVRANVVNEYNYYGLPASMKGEVYLQQESNLRGQAGLTILVNGPFEAGVQWDFSITNSGLDAGSIHLNAFHNIEEVRAYRIPSKLSVELRYNADSRSFNASILQSGQKVKFVRLIANLQEEVQPSGRNQLTINLQHNIPGLHNAYIPSENRICLHYINNADDISLGFNSNFDEKIINASVASSNGLKPTLSAQYHHNIETLMQGGILTASFEKGENAANLSATLTQDYAAETPMEISLSVNMESVIQGKYEITVIAEHNLLSWEIASPVQLQGSFNNAEWGNVNISGALYLSNVEEVYIGVGLSASETFRVLSSQYTSRHAFDINVIPKNIQLNLNINAENYENTVFATARTIIDGIKKAFNVRSIYSIGLPITNISASMEQDLAISLPKTASILLGVQLPSSDDAVIGVSSNLTTADGSWDLSAFLDTNVYFIGSPESPLGKVEVSFLLQNNVFESMPNQVNINMHFTRIGKLNFNTALDLDLDKGTKMLAVSVSNAQDSEQPETVQASFSITHNFDSIPDVPQNLHLQASGKRTDNGFMFSILRTINGEALIIGELNLHKTTNSAAGRKEFILSFQHSTQLLLDMYVPETLELNAYKEDSNGQGHITTYFYNLSTGGKSNSCTLTVTPSSVDLLSEHDWVTLTLITGLPYTSHIRAEWTGESFPFQKVKLSYLGDLQMLETTIGLSNSYEFSAVLNHNMRTWQILGLPMHNQASLQPTISENIIQVEVLFGMKDQLFTTVLTLSKEESETRNFRLDFSTNHNMTLTYPLSTLLRGQVSLTPDSMVNMFITLTLDESVAVELRQSGSINFQHWPKLFNINVTTDFTNSLPMFIEAGIPENVNAVATIQVDEPTSSGSLDVSLDGRNLLVVKFGKQEDSALTLSVNIGQAYIINLKEGESYNKSGINFELEFGDADDSDLSVFTFRADPQAILDFVIELDAPSFIPNDYTTGPISIAFQVDENELGLISARFEANLANENFNLCLSDITYAYFETGKWSLTYDLTVRHNITLLTDIGLATSYVINDRLYYGTKPNVLLEISSSMKSDGADKLTVIFKVQRDSDTPLSYKTLASIMHNTSMLNELLPQTANLRLVNIVQNDDVFGKILSMKATYQADSNQVVNIDITGGVGKYGSTIQGELTHQNLQWLAERLPTNDDLNRIKGKFEFVDLTAGYNSSITMQKSLELETVYGNRNGSAKITAERRRTDNEFSTGTLTANLDHQMPELRDAGISSKIDFRVSSVAYADSYKYDSIATWSGLDSVIRKINATMEYDGGFPSRMYGSHTLFVELFHPFEAVLPSPVKLTGSTELLHSRLSNNWRIKYDGKDQFVTEQRMETTKPKFFEADFILIQPMEEYLLKTLDLTTSVNMQGKTTTFLSRAIVNSQEPVSVSGFLKSLSNELVQRKGYEVNVQYQSGILGQVFNILQQNVDVEISVEKSLNSAGGSFNLTCAHRTLAGAAYARIETDGLSTLEMNVEQPFEVVFANGWAISRGAQLVITIDRRNENQIISEIYVDSDINPNRISLKTTLSKDYRDILYGFESILKRSTNTAEDWIAILNIRNNSFAEETNFTGEASIQCLSEDVFFNVVPSYGYTSNLRDIGVIVQHGVLSEQEWNAKWTDDLELNRVEVSVQTPYTKVIRNVFEKKSTAYGTQYSSIVDWSDMFQTEQYALLNSESIVLTSGFKTDKESGYISAQGKYTTDLLMLRLFQEDSTGPQFQKEDDLIQIALSVPVQGWMQFKMRSRREELSKTNLNVANLKSGVQDFTNILRTGTLAGQISQFDIADKWQATAFEWLQNKLRAIQQTTMQSSAFGSDGQLRTVIEQLGLPLSQLRRAYYDSFVQQLKQDSEEMFESIFEAKGQTKFGWLTVKYAKEILNHKIDTLDEQLYEMIAGSISPETSLIHLSDQQIIVNFPTVYSTNSLDVIPAANVIRDWLAGTVVTQVIRQALGYGMTDRYYRFLAYWNSEQAPPFPGFATVINSKQIVTFDGKLYDVEGLNCAHVLAHDFLDQNFTLIMQRTPEGGSSFLLKTKDDNKEPKTLQIQSTSVVSVNSQPVHLPYDDTTFTVRRSHTGIEIMANKRDVTLKCSYVSGFVCQLQLGAFYHGRVSGLMGTMDNEPENDIANAEGLSDDDVVSQQDSWAVTSNTSTITCQSISMPSSSCMENSDICTTLFDYSKSELRSCFPVVDPRPYLEACRRQLCNGQMACGLATAYRMKCKKFGATTNMPQRCVSCEDNALHPSSEELASGGLDTVIVMEGGKCLNNLRGTLPRLLRLLGSSQDNLRFGLVVYGTQSADLYTLTAHGKLMGTAHNLEKVLKRIPVASPTEKNPGTKALDAVKLAALFPFRSTSNRNVVMMTCSDCGESNQVEADEMNDLLNRRGISFHLIRGQGITTQASRSGKKLSSKSRVIGYERSGAFTKQSIRGNQLNTVAEFLNQIIPSGNDMCTTALSSINDYSVWNASEMATQVKRAGKDVTGAIANRMTIATSSRASTSTCNCRCEILSHEGVFRSVCGTC